MVRGRWILPDFVAANALGGWDLGRDAFNVEADDFLRIHDLALFQQIEIRHDHGIEAIGSGIAGFALQRHHADFLNVGRLQIVGLDFLGIDVLAVAEHDHVFLAAGDKQIAAASRNSRDRR